MEQPFVDHAIENLQQFSDFQMEWEDSANDDSRQFLRLEKEEVQIRFPVVFKKEFRYNHLPDLLSLKKKYGKLMIIGETIFANLKSALKENEIAYIDGAGNTFIREQGMFVLIEGKKQEKSQKPLRHKAFTKTGIKIVYHFLIDEELINQPYRNIALTTGASLDAISKTINSLKALGFIIKWGTKRLKLAQKRELLNRWIYQYGDKLKPSLLMDSFRLLDKEKRWNEIQLEPKLTQWGGEPGANLLTNYLRPVVLTMYTQLSRSELIKKYRMFPDKEGNYEVYKRFWPTIGDEAAQTVPPILVYADLIYSGEPRNLETAERIYEQYLQDEFK